MRLIVTRKKPEFWFWQCDGIHENSPRKLKPTARLLMLMYAYYDPDERTMTGHVLGIARLAGKMWVDTSVFANKTRRRLYMMYSHLWYHRDSAFWLISYNRVPPTEFRMGANDVVTTPEEVDLCDSE